MNFSIFKTLLPLIVFFASASVAAETNNGVLVGKVYDSATGVALYQEAHEIKPKGENFVMHSRYTSTNGELIGEREVEYKGDRVVRYQLQQAALGLFESIERTNTGLVIQATKNGELKTVNVEYDNPEKIVIDAGFDDFIAREWSSLVSGERIKFPFASTGQMDVVNLQLQRVDQSDKVLNDAGKVRFEMTVANPLLRLLVTPVTIEYFADTQELASYRGISNLKDTNLENFDAYIEFERDSRFRALVRQAKPLESKVNLMPN